MKKTAAILFILVLPALIYAQDARVVTFNHTLRWQTESQFPNYFLVGHVCDSIFNDIKQALTAKLNVQNVTFPDKVGYRIITGFGKPKNELSKTAASSDYAVDIFSFITRKTAGFAVEWSVNIVIRKDGNVVLSKEVMHEIENASAAAYLADQRWMSPQQFRDIFHELVREAIGMESAYKGNIIVSPIEEREKEVLSWFPNSTRYLLKCNGAMQTGNFAACLVNGNDTITHFVYKDKLKSKRPISLKPAFSDLFTDITGVGMDYSVVEKQSLQRTIVFPNDLKILIQMKWSQKVTASTVSDEVEKQRTDSLVGQIIMDTTSVGSFTYERVSQVLSTGGVKEKLTSLVEKYEPNSLGTVVIHRIRGTLNDRKFTAEYNQMFGISEIKIDNETYASMVFQNCNPANLQSFNGTKFSDKKFVKLSSSSNIGSPSLAKESKQEWYPFFIKESSTPEDIVTSLQILTCLFFGMGNM